MAQGEAVRDFLRTHPRLHLEYLPPYQPALNMQERIWRRILYEATTNCWLASLDDIWDTVQRTTQAWTPRKIERLCHIT
jgi:transposase